MSPFWFRRRHPPSHDRPAEQQQRQDAEDALATARRDLEAVRELRREHGQVAKNLRREREINHFAPAIAEAIRRGVR